MTELADHPSVASPYDLDDRYRTGTGPVLLTGVNSMYATCVQVTASEPSSPATRAAP
jgi:indolepyruvate ferredoxin oxidoreductase